MLPSWSSCGLSALALLATFLACTWPTRLSKQVPVPDRHLPYFGSLFYLLNNYLRLPDACVDKMHEYDGRTWGMSLPRIGLIGGAAFVVTTPQSLKHVLKDKFGNYVKGEGVKQCMSELLGEGIFATDGQLWTLHRKVASHMFSMRLLKESTRVAAWQTARLIAHLRTIDGPIDMQQMYFRLTMDIFAFVAFGEDLESVQLPAGEEHPFTAAFDEVQRCCEKRMYNPLWLPRKWLQLTSEERAIRRGAKVIDTFAARVIAGRRRSAEEGGQLGPDLLSRFVEDAAKKRAAEAEAEAAGGAASPSAEARLGGSDRELRDVVLNFIIAGRDTTACALSWTLYELARAPHVQQRLRDEFAAVFADELCAGGALDLEALWTYEKVAQLRYAHAVALEVLRLHPSVAKDIKWAVEDDTWPDGTFVPAGSAVVYCPYAMGRDPRRWEDPLRFSPERFVGEGGAPSDPSMWDYPTFNAGPRLCLGRPLAMMEVKLITATLMHHFDFELATPHEGGYMSTIVLPMSPGLMVRLTPRKELAGLPQGA